jgi:small subunit ribosomal protein S1
MSWTRKINHPSEVLEKGQQVEAVVLEVDPDNKRISLGLKQASDDPWNTITARYKIGDVVKGKVSKVASFGAFVELEEGVDGLVHISQISDQHIEKVRDALDVGQEVEARVIKIDQTERRIGLSIKALSIDDDDFVRQQEDLVMEGLRPGDNMVDLAGAFDEAFSGLEEWHPGESKND